MPNARNLRTTSLFVFSIVFSSFLAAQSYKGSSEDIDAILLNIRNFSTSVMNGDTEAIGMAYTADAKIFPNNRDIISGREAIVGYWTLPEGLSTKYHKITPVEINILGDEAYDYGYYEGTTLRADGSQSSWKGKYVIIWRKENGEWKMYLDIWNAIRE